MRSLAKLFCAVVVTTSLVACTGGSELSPEPPPSAVDTRRCKTTANEQFLDGKRGQDQFVWNVNNLDNVQSVNKICPTVTATPQNELSALFYIIRSAYPYSGTHCQQSVGLGYRQIQNGGGFYPLPSSQFTCVPDPDNQGRSLAVLNTRLNWTPGYDANQRSLDSLWLGWASLTGGFADASIVTPGSVRASTAGYIANTNPVLPERSSLFVARAAGDTNSYFHQWYVDGTAITGQVQAKFTYTFPDDASHTITDRLGRVDGTSFDLSTSFTPYFGGSLSGPTNLDAGQTGFWGYTDPGGRAPLSFTWTLDGSFISSDPSFGTTFNEAGGHTITVSVTDAVGRIDWKSLYVTVAPCTFGCNGFRIAKPATPRQGGL